jgi:hypothetical protein
VVGFTARADEAEVLDLARAAVEGAWFEVNAYKRGLVGI